MVQQALRGIELTSRIDRVLDYLFVRWEDIPRVASEWRNWDAVDRNVYEFEWAIPRGRIQTLKEWVAAGLLDEAQMARYRDLQRLMAEHAPVLDRMFAEEE